MGKDTSLSSLIKMEKKTKAEKEERFNCAVLRAAVQMTSEGTDGGGSRSGIIKTTDLVRPARAAHFEVIFCSHHYERQRFGLTHRLHSIKLIKRSQETRTDGFVLFLLCFS